MRLTSKQSKALANLSKAGVVNAFFRISATADGRYATVERDFSASGPVFVSNDDLILLEVDCGVQSANGHGKTMLPKQLECLC